MHRLSFLYHALQTIKLACIAQPANAIVIAFSIPVLFWLGWNTLDFYSHQRAYTDAGVFQAVAQHIAHGKTLYADIWDHKPPMIYFLNLLPIYLGDGSINAVRVMERFFILAGLFAFYGIALLISKRPVLALLAAFGFHYFFFVPEMFQGGNLTEEFASFFILFGILSLLLKNSAAASMQKYGCLSAGIFMSAAVFTKEPFLFSALPWLFYLCFEPKLEWKQRGWNVLFFIMGGCVVAAVFAILFWMQGNLDDWLQVNAYNRAYVEYSQTQNDNGQNILITTAYSRFMQYFTQQSWVWIGALVVGIQSCLYFPYSKQMRFLPVIFLLQFMLEQFAANLSRYDIGHYYLQYTASFCLLCLSGFNILAYLFSRYRIAEYAIAVMFLASMFYVDGQPLSLYRLRMNTPYREADTGIISKTLRDMKKEGDTLWTNLGEYSKYYAESGLLSPCPYLYAYSHLFVDSGGTTAQQKRDALTACLQKNPPAFMVLSDKAFNELEDVKLIALGEWIKQHYTPNFDVTENGAVIYVCKQRNTE